LRRVTASPHGQRRASLVAAIAITVGIAALTNGALAMFRLNAPGTQIWPDFAPPKPAIGIVWIALFAGMGAAYAQTRSKRAVAGLILLCLAYPFYTHVIGGHAVELAGNVVTFAYAVWLAAALRAQSGIAAACVGLVAVWIAFATALVVALVRLNGWAT